MSLPSAAWVLTPISSDSTAEASTFTPGVDLALDGDGDLEVVTDLRFTTGLEAVAQGLSIRLQSFRGEWFPDLDDGIPYLERDGVPESEAILGQKFDERKISATFRREIVKAPGVDAVSDLVVGFDGATREMTLSFTVTTAFGQITVSELEL